MKTAKSCFSLAALLVLFTGCSGNIKVGPGWEGEQVEAEGLAPYDAKNLADTKAAALAAAQRHAVEQVVGVFISGQTQVQHAVAIQQKILSRTQGFVKRYKITKEERDGDYWKTRIKAVVLVQDIGNVLEELKLASRPKNNTRVLVYVKSPSSGGAQASPDAAQGVYRALKEKSAFIAINTPDNQASPQDDTAAVEAAKQAGAGIVIVGEAGVYKMDSNPLGDNFVSSRANVSLHALAAGSGQQLAESSGEASAIDTVEAVSSRKALVQAGEIAGNNINKSLEAALKQGLAINVRITGLNGLDDLKKIEDVIRDIAAVQDITMNSYSRGDTELSVYTNGISGEELAASILRAKPVLLDAMSLSQFDIVLKVIQ